MAKFPDTFNGRDSLQPGARGETFKTSLPGYRGDNTRINRSNRQLSVCDHDVPNTQYEMDMRLPVLFTYGYAMGMNQLVMTKGRVVAVDPYMNQFNTDTRKMNNVLTLANGGSVVKLRADKTQWEPVTGEYKKVGKEDVYFSNSKAGADKIEVDEETGYLKVKDVVSLDYRPANKPIGIIERNEYSRNYDAFNGMNPGPVLTDKLIELPLFLLKAKAEENPWGSIYGNVLPGDYVKSDENGRVVISPLSRPDALKGMDAAAIEYERQQVIGQVYNVQRDLLPAGAARFAQWSLSDRMNFDLFNPATERGNNRNGEDINEHSPYNLATPPVRNTSKNTDPGEVLRKPGFEYDNTFTNNDLHMLGSSLRNSDLRMPLEYQMENGIPGLTDGYNAVSRELNPEIVGELRKASDETNYVETFIKTSEVGLTKGSIKIALTTKDLSNVQDSDFTAVAAEGQKLKATIAGTTSAKEVIEVSYMDETQGILKLKVIDSKAFHKFMTDNSAALEKLKLNIIVKSSKRGMSGVPTFLDWDGCVGVCSILLQK